MGQASSGMEAQSQKEADDATNYIATHNRIDDGDIHFSNVRCCNTHHFSSERFTHIKRMIEIDF